MSNVNPTLNIKKVTYNNCCPINTDVMKFKTAHKGTFLASEPGTWGSLLDVSLVRRKWRFKHIILRTITNIMTAIHINVNASGVGILKS